MSQDQVITLSSGSDDEDDFRVNNSKSKKQQKKERDKIEVKVTSRNSLKKDLDYSKIKKKYSIERKSKKQELPNIYSHSLFTGNHSKSKSLGRKKSPGRNKSPEVVHIDLETDKAGEEKMPPLADLKLTKNDKKPFNLSDHICKLARLTPQKSTSIIAQKSEILKKEFSSEPKNHVKTLPNPISVKNSFKKQQQMIKLPLNHQSLVGSKKEGVTQDHAEMKHVNGFKDVESGSKENNEGIEIVNLEDVPEKEKNKIDTNENEAVHENNEEKMDCVEDEKPDAKRKREEEEEVTDKDKEGVSKGKRPKNEEVAVNVPEIYNEFIKLLESIEENEIDREKALKKLNKYHSSADPKYTSSSQFKQLLKHCTSKIKNDKLKLYPMLNDIFASLKSARGKKIIEKRAVLKPANDAKAPIDRTEILQEMIDPEEEVQHPEVNVKNEKTVRRLIKTLKKLEKKIKKLEEAEVDLDDETDSSYFQMQKYRERFVQVHKKLCEYTGDSQAAGRVTKSKIPFSGTRYPAVNKCIERWLNKKRMFPDFVDILKVIEEQNKVDKLNLTPEGIRTLAIDAFRDVGAMLRRIRLHDFCDAYFTYLDDMEDPADNDPDLAEILRKNKEESSKKITEILNYYSEKEVKEHYVAEEVPDDEADRSPVESGDEDEKEIEEVENSLLHELENPSEEEPPQSEEEKKSKEEKTEDSPSTSGKPDNPVTAEPPPGETEKKPDEVTPVRESKNNYKHCKSLKWRRENNSKVNNSELCNGDNNKSVSDGDTVNGFIPEKGESLLKENCEGSHKSAGGGDKELVEKPEADLVDGVVDKDNCLDKKDFDCEIIDVDSPVTENSGNTYEHLKNNLNPKTFFVNYVRVEYFLKDLQRDLFKNPFDRSSRFALRGSTNLEEVIHLNDEGFRGNFKVSRKNGNRSPNFLKSKKIKIFKVPFRKRIKRNICITRCVLENNESKGVNGDGQGKEPNEGKETEETEETEEMESPPGNNGNGNGNDGDDGDEEDKDGKEVEKEEEEEEEEKEEEGEEKEEEGEENEKEGEEKEEEEEAEEKKEEVEETEEEKKDVCDREKECVNGNYDADTDEDSMDLKEKTEEKGEEECFNDFDEKLKAFEDALEDVEEDEANEKTKEKEANEEVEDSKVEEKEDISEIGEKMEEDEHNDKIEDNEKMEEDKVDENPEEKIDDNVEDEKTNEDEEGSENIEPTEMDASENLESHEETSNDSAEKSKNENEDQAESVEDKNETELSEHEPPEESSNDATEESKEEHTEDCKQDDNPKTDTEDTNETDLKTDEEETDKAEPSETREDENAANEEADADSKPEEQTEPSEDLNEDEPGPSSKRKTNEATDVEVLSFKKPKTAKTDPLDEEIVQNFLRHSPSSISITPPKKFSKPPSQEALNALATLRQMKSISTTRVTKKANEDDVQVIGESSVTRTRRINNGPISITRISRPQINRNQLPQNNRNQLVQNNRNRGGVPVISNVQSINRNNNLTPKIVTVQGNVSSFHNNRPSFNFGMPNRMMMNMPRNNMNMNSGMNMNSMISIPGFNHFPRFNNQFNNFSMFNNRQQPPLKISNVRGNISQTFRPQLQQQHHQQQQQQRRFVTPQTTTVVRQTAPSSSTVTKEKSKKPVEYVVLE